jgi:hydrogenase maturation protease
MPAESDPPAGPEPARVLIIGCGNVLRGDDAAGPALIRRLWEAGLPDGVHCADAGTGGMDVAFQMRGVPEVILVDASRTGTAPGTIHCVPGAELEQLPPPTGIHLHAFRWDHALAFARWLLKEEYPRSIVVYLIEGQSFEVGGSLSPPVEAAVTRLAGILIDQVRAADHVTV